MIITVFLLYFPIGFLRSFILIYQSIPKFFFPTGFFKGYMMAIIMMNN